MSDNPNRIETIDSLQVIQLAGRLDIVDAEKRVLVSFNLKDKVINFRKQLQFFNDNNDLFAAIRENSTNPQILDLFSNIGIDIKAPTFKIDYMDGNNGKLVGIGPDGLLKVSDLPDLVLQEATNVPGTPTAISSDTETPLGVSITLTKDVVNPELTIFVTTNENENRDYKPFFRVYEGLSFKGRTPRLNVDKDEIAKFSQSIKLLGAFSTGTVLSVTIETSRDIVLIDAYAEMVAKNA